MEDYPLTLEAAETVTHGRSGAEAIIKGEDDRLLVICGPCSVHDIKAGLEYGALQLKGTEGGMTDTLCTQLRFSRPMPIKPRMTSTSSCVCTSRSRAPQWAGRYVHSTSETVRVAEAASDQGLINGKRSPLLR